MHHANKSLIDNIHIPTFVGKLELCFDWILKLENIAVMTKYNPKELAIGKAQDAVIKGLYQQTQLGLMLRPF